MCARVYWVFIKELTWHFIIGGVKGMFHASSRQKLCFSSDDSLIPFRVVLFLGGIWISLFKPIRQSIPLQFLVFTIKVWG